MSSPQLTTGIKGWVGTSLAVLIAIGGFIATIWGYLANRHKDNAETREKAAVIGGASTAFVGFVLLLAMMMGYWKCGV